MTPKTPLTAADAGALLVTASVWGVNNVLTMVALAHLPPLLMVGLRFVLSAAALAPWLRLPKADLRPLVAVALLSGPVHFGLVYWGFAAAEDLTPLVIASQLWIPFSVALAALVLKERVGPLRGAGVGLAFGGVAAMAFDPVVFAQSGAVLLVAAAAAVWALVSILMRRFGALSPMAMQAWTAAISFPTLFAASAVFEKGQVAAMAAAPPIAWFGVVFAGLVSSVGANILLFRMVRKHEVSRTTPYLLATPFISVALGVAILGDPLTWQILTGAVLAILGVALCALAERRG